MIETTHYDLTLAITLFDRIELHFLYREEVLDEEPVRRLAGHFMRITTELVENPRKEAADMEMLSEEEKKQLLIDFNDTAADFPGEKMIHCLFEEQVEKTPDNIAVTETLALYL